VRGAVEGGLGGSVRGYRGGFQVVQGGVGGGWLARNNIASEVMQEGAG
jgi:hypothetical protein